MFIVSLDKYFTKPISLATVVEENDIQNINTEIYPAFGQLFDKTSNSISYHTIGNHSFDTTNRTITLPVTLRANQVYIAQTPGYDLTRELVENFGPLRSTIKKLYILNLARNAIFYNVKIFAFSVNGKVEVELSTDSQSWSKSYITIPVWGRREVKEIYVRLSVKNSQQAFDAIGFAIGYNSYSGDISYKINISNSNTIGIVGTKRIIFPINENKYVALIFNKTYSTCYGYIVSLNPMSTYRILEVSGSNFYNVNTALSQDRTYLFAYNKVFNTTNFSTVLTLNDVSSTCSAACFTRDNQYLIYPAQTGLKVIKIPSGEVVKNYTGLNLHSLARSAAIYASNPDEIWIFTGTVFEKFNTATQLFNTSNLISNGFFYSYWLDEKMLLSISEDTGTAMLLDVDRLSYEVFNINIVKTTLSTRDFQDYAVNLVKPDVALFFYRDFITSSDFLISPVHITQNGSPQFMNSLCDKLVMFSYYNVYSDC